MGGGGFLSFFDLKNKILTHSKGFCKSMGLLHHVSRIFCFKSPDFYDGVLGSSQ